MCCGAAETNQKSAEDIVVQTVGERTVAMFTGMATATQTPMVQATG